MELKFSILHFFTLNISSISEIMLNFAKIYLKP